MGSKGFEVQCLQEKIGITTDGIFGSLTNATVVAFQTAHGLKADGIIGPLSRTSLNNIVVSSIVYPAGCTSSIGYSTTTGTKCDGSSSGITLNNNKTLGSTPGNTNDTGIANPNLKNIDAYIAGVKQGALEGGLPADKLPLVEDKIRKEAESSTDFLQQFFDGQREIYEKKISENTSQAPLWAFLDKAVSFVDNIFSPEKASAAVGLPFGGFITYANPAICDCPPGVVTSLFVALANNGAVSNMLLNYVNGSEGFSYYNLPEPSVAVLGFYTPGVQSCWMYVGYFCYPIWSRGQITPEVGSSLTP